MSVAAARPSPPELSIVMPVYNEAEGVGPVVRAWLRELDTLKIDYEFLAFDDGSRDRTSDVLNEIARDYERMAAESPKLRRSGPIETVH